MTGINMADIESASLESSLTPMDWLSKMSVGGAMAGARPGQDDLDLSDNNNADQILIKAELSAIDSRPPTRSSFHDGKPPYSYANLITFAVNSSTCKKMTLSEIYQWICDNFPYYREAGNGWKVCDHTLLTNSFSS